MPDTSKSYKPTHGGYPDSDGLIIRDITPDLTALLAPTDSDQSDDYDEYQKSHLGILRQYPR